MPLSLARDPNRSRNSHLQASEHRATSIMSLPHLDLCLASRREYLSASSLDHHRGATMRVPVLSSACQPISEIQM